MSYWVKQTVISASVTEATRAQQNAVLLRQFYLVSGSNVLLLSVNVDPLSNVRALLLQSHQHVTRLVVKTCKRERAKEKREVKS